MKFFGCYLLTEERPAANIQRMFKERMKREVSPSVRETMKDVIEGFKVSRIFQNASVLINNFIKVSTSMDP